MDNCIFCKIVKKELPCVKIYEDSNVLAFLDISPVNLGHTLVIPKKHFRNALDTPNKVILKLFKISKKIAKALRKSGAHGINISLNNEEASGQSVFHTHMHVIPRFLNDGHKTWKNKKYKKGEADETAKKIISKL
jgi:histidine triad (HIT) family protein